MLATDTGLIRSSITLWVILANLDRGRSLSDKAGCRSVTEHRLSQVNRNVSHRGTAPHQLLEPLLL